MTREKALKARGLAAQHRGIAKRQATTQPSSGVSIPAAGGAAAGSGSTPAESTPVVPTSASETTPVVQEPVEETTSVAIEPSSVPATTEAEDETSSIPTVSQITSAIISQIESDVASVVSSAVLPSSSSSSVISSTTSTLSSSTIEITSSLSSRSVPSVGTSTNVIIRSITQTPSSVSAASESTSAAASDDSGPGTGAVVGIVAGALVGVVVLASLLGYFFKAKWGKDEDDIDDAVFNKDQFRRDSTMLPDDDGMSMRSGSVAGHYSNLSHSNSVAAFGGARSVNGGPRPPSILERHYQNASPAQSAFSQQQYANVQPGQYFQQPQYDQYGYPVQQSLDRQPSQSSTYYDRAGSSNGHYQYDLGRSNSSATTAGAIVYPGGAASERPLSEINEDGEEIYRGAERGHQRTGTPEEHNPQYYFRGHNAQQSVTQPYPDHRLSVRNNDDAYSGI